MDQLPFRAKPKVVDLTSTRKLADKVGRQCRGPEHAFHQHALRPPSTWLPKAQQWSVNPPLNSARAVLGSMT